MGRLQGRGGMGRGAVLHRAPARRGLFGGGMALTALSFLASCCFGGCGLGRASASPLDQKTRERAFIGYSEGGGRPRSSDQPVCKDEDENCASWAAGGECQKNQGFMEVGCPVSCNLCAKMLASHHKGRPGDEEGPLGGLVVLTTSVGDVRIRLRPDISPKTVAAVKAAAVRGDCGGGCRFYRSEKIPKPGARDNFGGPGPPYALVQGSLPALKNMAKEGDPTVVRGQACLINGGPDFFVAVGDHKEWAHAFTVWGEVAEEDMGPVDAITELPVVEQTWGQTHVTALKEPLPFTMHLEAGRRRRWR